MELIGRWLEVRTEGQAGANRLQYQGMGVMDGVPAWLFASEYNQPLSGIHRIPGDAIPAFDFCYRNII